LLSGGSSGWIVCPDQGNYPDQGRSHAQAIRTFLRDLNLGRLSGTAEMHAGAASAENNAIGRTSGHCELAFFPSIVRE
jgi:hypothetical protein